jgi:hypothetical protein
MRLSEKLTKEEYFAIKIAEALVHTPWYQDSLDTHGAAFQAATLAQALIKALKKGTLLAPAAPVPQSKYKTVY